jgi:hypothetical protein
MNDHVDFNQGTQSKCQNSSNTYDLNMAVVGKKLLAQLKPDLFFSSV